MAQECLGFAPERGVSTGLAQPAFAARLIQLVQEEYAAEPARVTRALMAFQRARQLARATGGDPCVVLAAALLLGAAAPAPEAAANDLAKVRGMLDRIGLGPDPARRVVDIVEAYWTGKPLDSAEMKVVCDCLGLANDQAPFPPCPPE